MLAGVSADPQENFPEGDKSQTRDIAAQKAGISSDRGVAIMTTAQVL